VRIIGHPDCDEEGSERKSIQEGVVVSELSVANLDLLVASNSCTEAGEVSGRDATFPFVSIWKVAFLPFTHFHLDRQRCRIPALPNLKRPCYQLKRVPFYISLPNFLSSLNELNN